MGALSDAVKILGGAVAGGAVGYFFRWYEDRRHHQRDAASKTREEHRRALSKVVPPVREAIRRADQFIEIVDTAPKKANPQSFKLNELIQKVIDAWESEDVYPFVTDEVVRRAWESAGLGRHAKRWVRAVRGEMNPPGISTGPAGWVAHVNACQPVAVMLRNALNGLLQMLGSYVAI